MSTETAMQMIEADLRKRIDEWIEATAINVDFAEAWQEVGYVGDNAARLMAKAAMAVFESSTDAQNYVKKNVVDF